MRFDRRTSPPRLRGWLRRNKETVFQDLIRVHHIFIGAQTMQFILPWFSCVTELGKGLPITMKPAVENIFFASANSYATFDLIGGCSEPKRRECNKRNSFGRPVSTCCHVRAYTPRKPKSKGFVMRWRKYRLFPRWHWYYAHISNHVVYHGLCIVVCAMKITLTTNTCFLKLVLLTTYQNYAFWSVLYFIRYQLVWRKTGFELS